MSSSQSESIKPRQALVKRSAAHAGKTPSTKALSAIPYAKPSRMAFKLGRKPDYVSYFKANPLDRVTFVKEGVPADEAKDFLSHLSVSSSRLYDALDLKASTFNRKAQKKDILSIDEAERIMGLVKLFGQVETMVQESGDPEGFDVTDWTMQWLGEPLAAFGGRKPMELMDTMEGQTLVSEALARIQTGAYA